ncbi:MAG: hypothetical protein J5957_00950 [Prevotella sp.]|nr:hypothetical protein [Prevotella sp.]
MAITSLPVKCFSSNIPDVVITTAMTRAHVVIAVDGTEIYDEYLTPFAAKITLTELCNLLQVYARQSLVANVTITATEQNVATDGTVTAGNTWTASTQLIYCAASIDIDASLFCERYFLSLLLGGTKVTASGRLEYVHYIGSESCSVDAHYTDGTTASFTGTKIAGNNNYSTVDVSPDKFKTTGKTLDWYMVTAGNRRQRFEMDFTDPDCAPILIFDNSFGVQELVYCLGTHTVDPNYERSSAWISGRLSNYQIEETRVFRADTGPLNTPMANWLDELFRSPEIYIVNIYDGAAQIRTDMEVVITESKSERTNDHDFIPRFTFSYQYAKRNHNKLDFSRAGRIFDNTFDATFN